MRATCALFLGLMVLAGCGGGSRPAPVTYPALSGNWQIQTARDANGTLANPLLSLLGTLSNSGSQVSGTFRFVGTTGLQPCAPLLQIVSLSGTEDSSGAISVTSAPFGGSVLHIALTPGSGTKLGPAYQGTIGVTGGACATSSEAALALAVPPVSGDYKGLLTPLSLNGLAPTPAATDLTLTQAAAANPDGQFALSGTLTIASGMCAVPIPVTGTVSGLQLSLFSAVEGQTLPSRNTQIHAIYQPQTTPATPAQLLGVVISFDRGPCDTAAADGNEYSGTLARQ